MTITERNTLISQNLDVANKVARAAVRRYRGAELGECEQVALLAMVEQADGYSESRGAPGPYFFRVGLNAVRLTLGIKTQDGHRRGKLDVMTVPGRGDMSLVEAVHADAGPSAERALDVAQQEHAASELRFSPDELAILKLVDETNGSLRAKMLAHRSGLPEARVEAILSRLARVIGGVRVETLSKVGRSSGAARSRRWFANLTPEKREARRVAARNRRAAQKVAA